MRLLHYLLILNFSLFFHGALFSVESHINPITTDLPPLQPNAATKTEMQIQTLNHLIEVTENSLAGQKKLLGLMEKYRSVEKAYLKNPKDNELLYRFAKAGHMLLQSIKDNDLTDTFDPDFLSELSVFSQFVSKHQLPPP